LATKYESFSRKLQVCCPLAARHSSKDFDDKADEFRFKKIEYYLFGLVW
jgi:hypothetical protein